MTAVELFQFQFSHYNEKARWALDWKRIPHVRRSYLPGLHMLPIRRLSGQQSLPVLRDGGQVIAGSARIVEHLEHSQPAPPLYPADAAARARALEIQRWFDEQVGAPVRAAFFHEVLPEGAYTQ
jgi:glutathione S-transferase